MDQHIFKQFANDRNFLVSTASAAVGLAAHKFVFIRGEHHLRSPLIFRAAVVFIIACVFLDARVALHGSRWGLLLLVPFSSALLSSIVVYRLFLHPLHEFRGPLLLRTTKLWHFFKTLNLKNCEYLDRLHHQYGDIVRTGECSL